MQARDKRSHKRGGLYLENFLVFLHQDAQVSQKLPHHLAPVEQQTHHDEAGHVAELLVRQNGVAFHVLFEVLSEADGFVEDVRFEEVAPVTRLQVVVVVQLPNSGRDFANFPPTAGSAQQQSSTRCC